MLTALPTPDFTARSLGFTAAMAAWAPRQHRHAASRKEVFLMIMAVLSGPE
jgi:hypothetical protein